MSRTRPFVLALALSLLLVPIRALSAQEGAAIALDPTSGPPGAEVTVRGTGWVGECGVNLHLDDPDGPFLRAAFPDENGDFLAQITIPEGTSPGEHLVVAVGLTHAVEFCGGPSGTTARAPFEVVASSDMLDRNIYLDNETLRDPGVDDGFVEEIQGSGDRLHGIVQLQRLPMAEGDDGKDLEELGIVLLDYLGGVSGIGTGYLAALYPHLDPGDPRFDELVRGLQPLGTDSKLDDLLAMKLPTEPGPIAIIVSFFLDVEEGEAEEILGQQGLEAERQGRSNSYRTMATADDIRELVQQDAVQWIQEELPFQPELDGVRAPHGVDLLQNLDTGTGVYGGLSGDGVQIAIMDTGVDNEHDDFAGRIIRAMDDGGSTGHGSHVAGIAAGSGTMSDQLDGNGNPNGGVPFQWRGMAPEAEIAAYGSAGGNPANFDDGINNFGVDVSNHSYALDASGQYSATVATVDSIIRGDSAGIPARPATYSAGNGGAGAQYGNNAGYFALTKNCKNCIIVANVNDPSLIHEPDSSMGPTMDGRLKPDIAAVGRQVTSVRANHIGAEDSYRTSGGTSMASPAIAGIIALMLEQYETTYGVNLDANPPLPSSIRAILAQTATDLAGTDPTTNPDTGQQVQYGAGPDWATGYGLANGPEAIEQIEDQALIEDSLWLVDHTDEWTFTVSPGETVNRATLAWDDRAATPNADEWSSKLVNDLDLVLIDPNGVEYDPLVLPLLTPNDCDGDNTNGIQVGTCLGLDDPNQDYFGPAAPGIDRRNNLEQVVVDDPDGLEPGTWTARVSVLNDDGTVRLPLFEVQSYSLTLDTNEVPMVDAGGPYVTDEGVDAALTASAIDPDGDDVTFAWELNGDGLFDDATGANAAFDDVGQDGVFPVCVRATDTAGAFDDACTDVTVNNVAPSVTDLTQDGPRPENTTVTLTGAIVDPGWEDPLSVTVDWGDGTAGPTVVDAEEHVRPDGTLEFTATADFGDDGVFPVEVCGQDDDTQTCDSIDVTFENVDPDAEIDLSGAVLVNGVPTILGHAGDPIDFSGNATDPGSDDEHLTWNFDDGTPLVAVTSLNDPLVDPDPDPSPSINPRDETDMQTHAFAEACAYEPSFTAEDDDGGSDVSTAAVLITGNADKTRPTGWWQSHTNGNGSEFPEDELLCYLEIAVFGSAVFDEEVPLSTRADAHDVLHPPGPGPEHLRMFDRELLAAWLNLANGVVDFLDLVVDTDGDGTADATFGDTVAAAETVRLNPASTPAEVDEQRALIHQINN